MKRRGLVCSVLCLAVGGLTLPSFAQQAESPVNYGPPPQSGLANGVYDLTNVYGVAGQAFAEDSRAYTELNLTVIRLQREFKVSLEFKAAVAAVDDAYDALEAARRPVLEQMEADSTYQDLAIKRQTVALELQAANLPSRDVLDLATSKMQYSSEMHRMEAAALAKDSDVQAARKNLIAAQRKLDDLRDQFEMSLYKNAQWATAKLAYDNAEVALGGAEGAVLGANITACLASEADARRSLYNYQYGNFTYGNAFIDPSSYYGRRY